ncbi:hypothetical protein PV773_19675 [Mesorhizobium sp. CC13]|uniref:hypothetical protein n=1 Tax=Mesorhizobium sp. CC13 TaxID=3029194 RepID=UPI0032653006
MSRVASTILAVTLGAGAALLGTGAASAADLAVGADYGDPGICGNASVLNRITERFSYQVRHVPNLPDVAITDFQRVHEHRYLAADEDHPIARRYCGATVALSDGGSRDIWYLIEEGMGFASIGDNVEFCVAGFDRWYVYNGRCRVLR